MGLFLDGHGTRKALNFFYLQTFDRETRCLEVFIKSAGQTGGRQKLCFSFIPTDYLNGQYGYDITHLRISIGLGRFPYSKRYSISFIPPATAASTAATGNTSNSGVCSICDDAEYVAIRGGHLLPALVFCLLTNLTGK